MKNEPGFTRLSAAETEALLKRPQLRVLDVRDANAFACEHIAGAIHFDGARLDQAVRSKTKHQPMLVYCYHGHASQTYAQTLADFGYREVYDLVGGYEAWRSHLTASAGHTPRPASAPLSAALAAWLSGQGFPSGDLAATVENRHTALMRACQLGELAIADELMRSGASLQATNGDGNNALWLACYSGHVELIDLLIAGGIEIDRQNDNGATCLMYAASSGKTEVLIRLLAGGASLDLTSLDDFSALDMAANIECLQLLSNAARRQRQGFDRLA